MSGKKGFGAIFEYSTDGGTTWIPIAQITKIRPYAAKADVIDVSSHDSASGYREKLAGLLEVGQAQLDLNYDEKNTGHAWLLTNLGVASNFRVTFYAASAPKHAAFAGFVAGLTPELPHDNKQTATATIEITGVVTIS